MSLGTPRVVVRNVTGRWLECWWVARVIVRVRSVSDDVVAIDVIAVVAAVVFFFLRMSLLLLLLSFVVSVLTRGIGNVLIFFLQVNGRDGNNGEEAIPAGRYECDRCGQVYRHRTSLRRHQRQAHTGRQTCPECGEVLQGEESLARHITLKHGGRQLDDVANGQLATIPPPPPTTGGCSG